MKITKFLIAGVFTLASFGAQALTLSVLDSTGDWDTIDVNNAGVVKTVDLENTMTDGGDWTGTATIGSDLSVPGAFTGFFIEFSGAPSASVEVFEGASSLGVFNASAVGSVDVNLTSPSTMYSFVVDGNDGTRWDLGVQLQAVPIPAAAWLFGSGLIGLAGIARRKKATA